MTSTCLLIATSPDSGLAVLTARSDLFHRCFSVARSDEGLALLEREAVDLVLFSLEGGREEGRRQLRRLCRRAADKEVPVVALGAAGTEEGILALEAGAADALPSGISGREAALRLRRQVETKRRLEELRRDRDALSRQALTDTLTGLGNRRYFQQRLASEAARTSRSGEPFALMMIDMDHFKKVNDTFGHPVGDRVLQAVAGVLRHGVRRSDVACRLGGEEFVLLLPGTTAASAGFLAEKLRRRISDACRGILPSNWPVTVSIGVSWTARGGAVDAERLVWEADRALYSAKGEGRDRIAFARPEPSLIIPADLLLS